MLRNDDGTLRRDLLRSVAKRVEITSPTSVDMMRSRIEFLRTLAANGGVEAAALDVRSFCTGLARPAGFEPATARLEGECSIQLS
jgi:hypothetical protein